MNSLGLHQLVKNFTNLTLEESRQLRELSYQYPYSQLFHLLSSRAALDLGDKEKDALLHLSAVYSTDRAILKEVMTAPRQERMKPTNEINIEAKQLVEQAVKDDQAPTIPIPANVKGAIQPVIATVVAENSLSGDELRTDLDLELKKLQRLKHAFEESIDAFERSASMQPMVKETKDEIIKEISDPLIEEIKSTKRKLRVDNPKQKEQNEIIDNFIKTQPVIPKAKALAPANDLVEDSGIFSDNIVSETLVDILLKQGKKEKAIEVLKKLIWKFPQKKTYFAAQIENLKN